ncbi:MAG TPA: hypothetical protein VGB88_03120 [Alphaproteobacteria bacterium]
MNIGAPNYAEEQLGATLRNIAGNPLGWQAVHLHLSGLAQRHRREGTVRIALKGLQELVHAHEGRIFVLFNFDIVLLVRGALVSEVQALVDATRALFTDDRLSREARLFSTWYDLSITLGRLEREVRRLALDKLRLREGRRSESTRFFNLEPLDPGRLYKLQAALATLDISGYVRHQPVCALLPHAMPRRVFEEIYVHIADLQKPLMPNVNLAGNLWLFQHLTRSLDQRVLAMLTRQPEDLKSRPISLNMNIDTILSQSFLAFDDSLKQGLQRRIVIEVQPVDVFADVKAFQLGREFVRRKGYRLCLDGLKPETLPLCGRASLGVDLIKLHWDDSMAGSGSEAAAGDLGRAIREADSKRVILTRCDDQEAVEFGFALGINLFQGRHIDEMLRPGSHSRN